MFCLGHLSFGFHSEQEAIKAYSIYSHTPPQSDTHPHRAQFYLCQCLKAQTSCQTQQDQGSFLRCMAEEEERTLRGGSNRLDTFFYCEDNVALEARPRKSVQSPSLEVFKT